MATKTQKTGGDAKRRAASKAIKDPVDKVRLQFDFTELAVKQIEELMKDTGATTRAEVIRNALTLYYEAIRVQLEGGKFGFLDKDGGHSWYVLPGVARK